MTINQIIPNFFSKEEKALLKEYVENEVYPHEMFYRQPELGRMYASIAERFMIDCIGGFPKSLLQKVKLFAQDYFHVESLELFDIILVSYSNNNGLMPKLPLHTDNGVLKKYTIDYQYDSNIDWPLTIDDRDYQLINNSIVTFVGSHQKHGRPDRIFNDGEFVENIFFQFIEKREKWQNKQQ
jgi:hypothetical protein